MHYGYCNSKIVKKNGKVKGVQLYKYHACGKQFLGRERIENDVLWEQYVHRKQTYQQLSEQYQCSVRTIQRRLSKIAVVKTEKRSREVIILLDTTY